MSTEERIAEAKKHKEAGNAAIKAKEPEQALAAYMEAVRHLDGLEVDYSDESDPVAVDAKQLKLSLELNLALVHTNMGNFSSAVSSSQEAMRIDATSTKAMYRCGVALRHLGEFADSKACLRRAVEVNPKDKCVVVLLCCFCCCCVVMLVLDTRLHTPPRPFSFTFGVLLQDAAHGVQGNPARGKTVQAEGKGHFWQHVWQGVHV